MSIASALGLGGRGSGDLLVIEATLEALATRHPVAVAPLYRTRRIDPDHQEQTLRPVSAPSPVQAASPTGD